MPRTADLNVLIRTLVAQEIAASLRPIRESLRRLEALATRAESRRGRPARAASRRAAGGQADVRIAQGISTGQTVEYKQGRGAFPAKVLGVDLEKGLVRLERMSDGKEVVRPASKVRPIDASAVVAAGKPGRKPGRPAKRGAKGDVSAFSEGQTVSYKQGRGTFDAEVVGIDAEKGTLALQRLSDGKKIVRPAVKVSPTVSERVAPVKPLIRRRARAEEAEAKGAKEAEG